MHFPARASERGEAKSDAARGRDLAEVHKRTGVRQICARGVYVAFSDKISWIASDMRFRSDIYGV